MILRTLIAAALLTQVAAQQPPAPSTAPETPPEATTVLTQPGAQSVLTDQDDLFVNKVPVLGDVPVVGNLFRYTVTSPFGGKSIDVDLDDASLQDALHQIVNRSGIHAALRVDTDAPTGARITFRARSIRPELALELIAENAGVGWAIRRSEGDGYVLHVGKTVQRNLEGSRTLFFRSEFQPGVPDGHTSNLPITGSTGLFSNALTPGDGTVRIMSVYGQEERATLKCPHCGGVTTVTRVRKQPTCPKCGRVFQPGWQYCPIDGTRRPAEPAEFRYCPLCGKPIDSKAEGH